MYEQNAWEDIFHCLLSICDSQEVLTCLLISLENPRGMIYLPRRCIESALFNCHIVEGPVIAVCPVHFDLRNDLNYRKSHSRTGNCYLSRQEMHFSWLRIYLECGLLSQLIWVDVLPAVWMLVETCDDATAVSPMQRIALKIGDLRTKVNHTVVHLR